VISSLRRAAVLLLLAWCGLGLLHTGYVMVRPHGLVLRRPPTLARTIGLPGADDGLVVQGALELLDGDTAHVGGPVLVLRPPEEPLSSRDYVHFQLAHLAYPRRIDVMAVGEAPPLVMGRYAALIAPRGVPVDAPWRPVATRGALTLHRSPPR
jgi:hypothetical protein